MMSGQNQKRPRMWIVAGLLLALALFMYVSIMYKITNFGP